MNKGLIGILVVVVILLGLGGWAISGYNGLVGAENEVKTAWAQVDNQLQRRNDLLGNLVETVRGAAIQEQTVFGDIAAARAAMSGAKSPAAGIAAAQGMDSAISRLLVVVENYPTLKSNEQFAGLRDEIAGTENRIAVERMRYNDTVKAFNNRVQMFPGSIIAGLFHKEPAPFYPVPEAAKAVPKVDFGGLRQGGGAAPDSGK